MVFVMNARPWKSAAYACAIWTCLLGHAAAEEEAPAIPGELAGDRGSLVGAVAWRKTGSPFQGALGAWVLGNRVCIDIKKTLLLLDAATGEEKAKIETGSGLRGGCYPAGRPDRMLVCNGDELREVELEGGKVIRRTLFPIDPRLAPIPFEEDLIVVRGYEGKELVRIDRSGRAAWTVGLPGCVSSDPIRHDALLIVQTDGETTAGVDLREGKILWSVPTDARGYGVASANDGARILEAEMYLSPEKREGCVDLVGAFGMGRRPPWEVLKGVAMPSIVDNKMIVATNLGFAAREISDRFLEASRDGGEPFECCCGRLSASVGRVGGVLLSARVAPASSARDNLISLAWTLHYDGPLESVTILELGLARPTSGQTAVTLVAEGKNGKACSISLRSPAAAGVRSAPAEAFLRILRNGEANGSLELDLADVKASFRKAWPGLFESVPPPLALQLIHKPSDRGEDRGLNAWTGTLQSQVIRISLGRW